MAATDAPAAGDAGTDPTRDAVAAAVAAAAALGVTGVEPMVLADGSNVIIHLAPSPLVAKVPGSSSTVRRGLQPADRRARRQHRERPLRKPGPARSSGTWRRRPPARALTAPGSWLPTATTPTRPSQSGCAPASSSGGFT